LQELDPDRTLHEAYCAWCQSKPYVPLRSSRLEARPWRLTWICPVCGNQATARVHAEVLPALLALDKAGGMRVSRREVDTFAKADEALFEAAVITELL